MILWKKKKKVWKPENLFLAWAYSNGLSHSLTGKKNLLPWWWQPRHKLVQEYAGHMYLPSPYSSKKQLLKKTRLRSVLRASTAVTITLQKDKTIKNKSLQTKQKNKHKHKQNRKTNTSTNKTEKQTSTNKTEKQTQAQTQQKTNTSTNKTEKQTQAQTKQKGRI